MKVTSFLGMALAAATFAISVGAMADDVAQVAEVGCASCSYGMDSVKGCKTAVKLGDSTNLVEGLADFDAHTEGLCKSTKQVYVTGSLQDGTFQASSLKPVSINQIAEIACGTCIYGMEGSGCPPAVKIDGTAYWMRGLENFNAHGEGLCDAAKPAHLVGNIEKGKFVAAAVEIDPKIDQIAEVGCASCMYSMDGVKGCKTAVKLGGAAHLVEGSDLDAHAAGLCKSTNSAHVVGKLDAGTFVAESLVLEAK